MKDEVNILLVDDQPAKLLSYEVMLQELGENLIKASSAREALEQLLKREIAIVLVDVCMPELDGFQLAAMIREHPRFQKTAIIFISAVHLTDMDRLRGYAMGAVDYVPVPVIPDVLRAKVKVFAELYRKTRQLEQLNQELERRVADRTSALEASTTRLVANACGTRASAASSASIRRRSRSRPRTFARSFTARTWSAWNRRCGAFPRTRNPTRPSSACAVPMGSCAGASAPRPPPSTRPSASFASAA